MSTSLEAPLISDQTITIFTWISISVICQLINLFGIVTNSISIVCFIKQGFDDSVNVSLLGLAVSDLGSLVTKIFSSICATPAVVAADLPFDPLEVGYLTSAMLHFAFNRVSGCITAMVAIERCLCIIIPLKVKSIVTPKRTAVITVSMFIVFISSGSPVYFVNSFAMKFSSTRNKTLFGLVSTGDREHVEKISFAINNFVIPFGAFAIIVVCTAILSFKLRRSSKWRQLATGSSNVDSVSERNQKAAKMVVMISVLFIVCFIPVCTVMLAMGLVPSLSVNGKDVNITLLMFGFIYILESVNSSMNIFIYYHMSTKYRCILRNTFYVMKEQPY